MANPFTVTIHDNIDRQGRPAVFAMPLGVDVETGEPATALTLVFWVPEAEAGGRPDRGPSH